MNDQSEKEGTTIRKGEKTKHSVIERTALLLNQQGYLSTSLAEITDVTGLQKGGIYNHFRDKEELVIESFKHCCALVNERMEPVIASGSVSTDRLNAFIDFYLGLDFPGGCPIVNATVEANGVSTPLFQLAREAMDALLGLLEDIVATGMAKGEIRPTANPREAALFILSAVEGGLIMQKLYPASAPIDAIKKQLLGYVNGDLKIS